MAKGFLTGLFHKARKSLMTTDNDMGAFRDKLNELVDQKDTLDDDAIAAKVDEIKGFTGDLPEGDEKSKLDRFLEDFKQVKGQDPATAKKAVEMVADLFEKLDKEAMQDAPAEAPEQEPPAGVGPPAEGEAADEETSEAEGDDGVETPEGAVETTEPPATEGEEETAEEEGEATDADPNAEYTLEEIYQFIKKRQAEDAEAADEACTDGAPEEGTEEKDDDQVVTDHAAPSIAVSIGNTATAGGLSDMFANIKRGER